MRRRKEEGEKEEEKEVDLKGRCPEGWDRECITSTLKFKKTECIFFCGLLKSSEF
jgi:hypothetical protein